MWDGVEGGAREFGGLVRCWVTHGSAAFVSAGDYLCAKLVICIQRHAQGQHQGMGERDMCGVGGLGLILWEV